MVVMRDSFLNKLNLLDKIFELMLLVHVLSVMGYSVCCEYVMGIQCWFEASLLECFSG